MIQLTCTHCQTVLSIDEGFAGGVCRCQHCGTIQTVPAHLKAGSAVGVAVREDSSSKGGKTLYQNRPRENRPDAGSSATGSGTGLEDLAQVVASSGLSNSGLSSSLSRSKRTKKTEPEPKPEVKGNGLQAVMLFGGGVLVAAIIGVAVWWFMGRSTSAPATGGDSAQPSVVSGPSFLGQPIEGSTVVYLLDRGESAKEVFDAEKDVAFASIKSLGPDRKFAIMFWDNHTDEARYPLDGATFAIPANIEAAKHASADVIAYRQSTIKKPLQRAMQAGPDSLVIVTAKGGELDDTFVSDVMEARKDASIRVYGFSLRDQASSPLQALAQKTGGAYKVISDGALKAALP